MEIDSDELFEAAGYPTVRTLRETYQNYEATVDPELMGYLSRLPRDRQRRLLAILEGMETVLSNGSLGNGGRAGDTRQPHGPQVRSARSLEYSRFRN
jgi:hypothetical protein